MTLKNPAPRVSDAEFFERLERLFEKMARRPGGGRMVAHKPAGGDWIVTEARPYLAQRFKRLAELARRRIVHRARMRGIV